MHVYNRDGLHTAADPYELFPKLGLAHDGAHAFYVGMELARAQIAWQLGKRYVQDEELDWGCTVEPTEREETQEGYHAARSTLDARRRKI